MSTRQWDTDLSQNLLEYRVTYWVLEDGKRVDYHYQQTFVEVIPGYSTFGDIPKIIATSRGIKAEDVLIRNVDAVGILLDGVRY